MVVQSQAIKNNPVNRMALLNPQQTPKVGFKEEPFEAPRDGIDNMLQAIANGELPPHEGDVANLGDLSNRFKSREQEAQLEMQDQLAYEQEERLRNMKVAEDLSRFFVNAEGKPFDPVKKFGSIEDGNQLIYDNITTSYALNLPPDFYLKAIQKALPQQDQELPWYIKPHHVESLTQHSSSIRDDFLNTRYYSLYNQDYGRTKQEVFSETAVDYIESQIDKLKLKQENLAPGRGINFDSLEQVKQ